MGKMKRVLHIANNYCGSTVYRLLVEALDRLGVEQVVYALAREESAVGRNAPSLMREDSAVVYSTAWKRIYRALYHVKLRAILQDVEKNVDLSKIGLIHAHTLFSDGILALKLKKQFGIPYVVSVRNTDLNLYMRYMPHTWMVGRQILQEADQIIFISKAHMRRAPKWVAAPKDVLERKAVNIPNGIDDYWLERIDSSRHIAPIGSPWRLIYVGNFTLNKNVPRLMLAALHLNERGLPATLDIVGAQGRDTNRIVRIAQAHPEIFKLHGEIRDKDRLRALFREMHIFALVSLRETFGLVYVEALTQGLPILYSKGEGVDGFFDEQYGMACNPRSRASIETSLERIMEAYPRLSIDAGYLSAQFDWRRIAGTYRSLYSKRG